MRRVHLYILGIIASMAITPVFASNITLDIFPSSAPNVYGSPSWGIYVADALNSLENGLGTTGDRNLTPTAYEVLNGTFAPGDVMVTSFNSWRGVANPPIPFNGEYGNRIHFGLHAYGNGQLDSQFRLNTLTFFINSSDTALNWFGDFIGYDFNGTTRYGIDWGDDRVKGGVDDTLITGADSGMVLIDELVYVGVGNAYWPADIAEMTDTTAYIYDQELAITGGYCVFDAADQFGHCSENTIVVQTRPSDLVPEPASLTLLGAGLLALRRIRRSKMSAA